MNCEQSQQLIHAYLDQELDAANAIAVEQHLQTCSACQRDYTQLVLLGESLRDTLPYHSTPEQLRASILAGFEHVEPTPVVPKPVRYVTTLALAAAFSFCLVIVGLLFYRDHQRESMLIDEVLAGHVRALNTQRLTEIDSSDTQKLKPWFTSKLNYSPKVYNLAAQGFALLGGRLDYLQQRHVASMAYRYNEHIIDLYTWPSPDVADAAQELHSKNGYKLLYWCQDSMNYWVVSDLDSDELRKFATLLQQKAAH
jgi:anti-sigma factor RsiW